jgi:ankyrin repeat protein
MKKRIVFAMLLAVLLAASAYAQSDAFFDLVKHGTPQEVQAAISNGADANARGGYGLTPLIWAAQWNENPEVFTILVKAGADIEAQVSYAGGGTALVWAAKDTDNPDVITTLLKAGANAKAKDHMGKIALDYAKDNEKLKGTNAFKQLEEASK